VTNDVQDDLIKGTDSSESATPSRRKLTGASHDANTVFLVAAGQVLNDHYRLVREIARGGMGIVFEAEDVKLAGRRVAVKVLPPEVAKDKGSIVRLQREAASVCSLEHSNIVRLIELNQDGDCHYMVLEYLDGDNLSTYVAEKGSLPVDEVLAIARDVVPALAFAHDQNVIHRDIKPANLMFKTVAGKRVTKITDFGIAYQVRDSMTRLTGQESLGTLLYIAPELLRGKKPSPASDQYGLAATLYELLEGDPPFTGAGLSHQIIEAEPQPLDGVPAHVNAAILRGLAKNPEERFPDCMALLAAFEQVGEATPAGGAVEPKQEPPVELTSSGHLQKGIPFAIETGQANNTLRSRLSTVFLVSFVLCLAAIATGWRSEKAGSSSVTVQAQKVAVATSSVNVVCPPTLPPLPAPTSESKTTISSPAKKTIYEDSSQKPQLVEVNLSSQPPGAKVYCINDDVEQYLGCGSPDLTIPLPPGKYKFRFADVAGYQDKIHECQVSGPKPMAVAVTLDKAIGNIVFDVDPPNATIVVDGVLVPDNLRKGGRVHAGRHFITFMARGYNREQRTVTVDVDRNVQVAVKMTRLPTNAQAYMRPAGSETSNTIGMEFVRVPAGKFLMGGPPEYGRFNEANRTSVELKNGFWIGKYEVTQDQWGALMNKDSSKFRGARLPVENVSWDDCQEFIKRLNACEPDATYTLPTEAQWEYACRAGTTTAYSFGKDITSEQANFDGSNHQSAMKRGQYRQETTIVGSFPANAWKLHDMHGNVAEWCQDWFGSLPRGAVVDPSGPKMGTARIIRGGSWLKRDEDCRSYTRSSLPPSTRLYCVGFRLVVRILCP